MKLQLRIALKYLFAPKSHSAINIISVISALGVAVGTAALIIVLSVYNGFEGLIGSMYSSFNPEYKILPKTGKVFNPDTILVSWLDSNPMVDVWSQVVEGQALAKYGEHQAPVMLKGVDEKYAKVTGIDSVMFEGHYSIRSNGTSYCLPGRAVSYMLGAGLKFINPFVFYVPRRSTTISVTNPESGFNQAMFYPCGFFSMGQPEIDGVYVIIPLEDARRIMEYSSDVSAIEIKLIAGANQTRFRKSFAAISGNRLDLLDRFQQESSLFNMMNIEKWVTFLILTFILMIAAFNVVGTMSMLMIDKKRDITTLRNMGATRSLIESVFFIEGWLIALLGAVSGLFFGALLCFLQITFGFVKFGNGGFIIDSYPVQLVFTDFLIIFSTVLIVGVIAAWIPVKYIIRKYLS